MDTAGLPVDDAARLGIGMDIDTGIDTAGRGRRRRWHVYIVDVHIVVYIVEDEGLGRGYIVVDLDMDTAGRGRRRRWHVYIVVDLDMDAAGRGRGSGAVD